jgi:hypothetical protein
LSKELSLCELFLEVDVKQRHLGLTLYHHSIRDEVLVVFENQIGYALILDFGHFFLLVAVCSHGGIVAQHFQIFDF